jgi:hypothetical protein
VKVRLIGVLTSAPDGGKIHDVDPLLPREEDRRLGGPRSRSGLRGKETNLLSLLEIEPRFRGCSVRNLHAISTELPRFPDTAELHL